MKEKFDQRATQLAKRYGMKYEDTKWVEITQGVTVIYLILTMLAMF